MCYILFCSSIFVWWSGTSFLFGGAEHHFCLFKRNIIFVCVTVCIGDDAFFSQDLIHRSPLALEIRQMWLGAIGDSPGEIMLVCLSSRFSTAI